MTEPGAVSYGENSIAAKLSLELPNDSERMLNQIAEQTGAIRTNMEAAARFSGEYIAYIQSFPTMQRIVNDMLEDQLRIIRDTSNSYDGMRNGMLGTGSGGYGGPGQGPYGPPGAGYGTPPPVGGYGAGYIGPGGTRLPPGYGGPIPAGGGSTGNPNEDITRANQQEIERQQRLRDRHAEREEARRQAHHNPHPPVPLGPDGNPIPIPPAPEPDEGDPANPRGPLDRRIREAMRGGANGADDITRLFSPVGGGVGTRMAALSRLIGTQPDEDGNGGTGALRLLSRLPPSMLARLGPLAGALPAAAAGAAVVAGGALAFNGVQNAGEAIQRLRNQDVNSHSLGPGLGIEKDVLLMSLNPLLTSEQSRQIIMAPLRGGYEGKQYDTAVEFIKDNMVNMNMSVADSMNLLKTNVDLSNQSITGLAANLNFVQGFAADGSKTLGGINDSYSALSGTYSAAGIDAQTVAGLQNESAAVFNGEYNGAPDWLGQQSQQDAEGNLTGPNRWAQLVDIVTKNRAFTTLVYSKYGKSSGSDGGLFTVWTNLGDQSNVVIWDVLADVAKQSTYTAFVYRMNSFGLTQLFGGESSIAMQEMYKRLRETKVNPIILARKDVEEKLETKTGGESIADLPSQTDWLSRPENEGKTAEDYSAEVLGTKDNSSRGGVGGPLSQGSFSERLRQALATDPRSVIQDPEGNWHLINPQDPLQGKGLDDGTWKIIPDALSADTQFTDEGGLKRGSPSAGQGGNLSRGNAALDQELKERNKENGTDTGASTGDPKPKPSIGGSGSNQNNWSNAPASFSSGSVDMGGAPASQDSDGRLMLGITPDAMNFFLRGNIPGYTKNDTGTKKSNSGVGGNTRNSNETTTV